MFRKFLNIIIGIFLTLQCLSVSGQVKIPADTSLAKKDTTLKDSLALTKKKGQPFKSKVEYVADDSMRFSLDSKRVYMYKNSKINYEDMELKSERVDFDMQKSEVYASGTKDTTGKYLGKPHMKQSQEEFDADSLLYNFKTKRGKMHQLFTKQEDGYLHAEVTQKQSNGEIHLINGKYTTCDLEHPHFYLDLTKAIVIPNSKIVAGPAYIVMEDIPLPIGIPFGFFPSKKTSASGVIIPTYGEEATRGFFLRNGGYYFALSKYFDLALTSEIYSRGSWGVATASRYVKRYKYNGNFNLRYNKTKTGDELQSTSTTDYSIQWTHAQASQANPYQTFSANVNFSSTKYDKLHSYTDPTKYLNNRKSSSISFNKTWPNNSPLNLSANLRHDQNSQTKQVSLTLPSIAFNINRIYLFRGKDGGSGKWWDDISISYTSSLENRITAHEDSLFTSDMLKKMQNGFKHSIPFGTTFKLWKKMNVNLSPSLNYQGMVYSSHLNKHLYETADTAYVKTDTIHKFAYAQGFSPSLSLAATPTIYGTYNFKNKNSKIVAIRHVIRPSASLSFVPSLSGFAPDYTKTYTDTAGEVHTYTIYNATNNVYDPPVSTKQKSGSISFGLFNNLEMKVKSDKDTLTGTRKIKLIDNLSLSSSYNLFADSNNWSAVSFNGSTTLMENWSVNLSGSMDMYAIRQTHSLNSISYSRDKVFEFERTGRLARLTSVSVSTGYRFQSKQGTEKKEDGEEKPREKNSIPDEYDYFNIPWSFDIDYDFTYSKPYYKSEIQQTFRFSGNFSLTPKWKINFTSGYDMKLKQFSYTTIGLDRDLHCWQMTFSCSPFGTTKFYNFQINVKSAILKDLKYDKRKSIYDYQY